MLSGELRKLSQDGDLTIGGEGTNLGLPLTVTCIFNLCMQWDDREENDAATGSTVQKHLVFLEGMS